MGTMLGRTAPDREMKDETGALVKLSELWSKQPLVLVFVRHLGCPLCRAHLADLQKGMSQDPGHPFEVAVVTMGAVDQNAEFKRSQKLSFRLLSDPDRQVYRAFEVPRGGLSEIAGISVWRQAWRALRQFGRGKIVGDVYQMPGSFVIDTSGTVVFAHYAKNSADWAPYETHRSAYRASTT